MRGLDTLKATRYADEEDTIWLVRRAVPHTMDRNCPSLYYGDGRYMSDADAVPFDVVSTIDHIERVKAYSRPASMWSFYNHTGAMCGVIAFWTK